MRKELGKDRAWWMQCALGVEQYPLRDAPQQPCREEDKEGGRPHCPQLRGNHLWCHDLCLDAFNAFPHALHIRACHIFQRLNSNSRHSLVLLAARPRALASRSRACACWHSEVCARRIDTMSDPCRSSSLACSSWTCAHDSLLN